VVGEDRDGARAALQDAGFEVRVREEPSAEEEGTVISQSPAPGTRLTEGSTVTITVAVPEEDGGTDPGEGDGDSPDDFEGEDLSSGGGRFGGP
jgi:serine/threonine-protein kinase